MLPYFPSIYPDELLYSVVARYHRHTGTDHPKLTMAELFGNRNVLLTPFLVGQLRDLARRLPAERGLTPERLAVTATFYPYCVAYEPPPVRRAMLDAITHRPTERRFATWDIAANPLHFAGTLRWCRACAVEAAERYGEPYWRRAHQLPGVLVCPEHGVPLMVATNAPPSTAEHQSLVTAPSADDALGVPQPAWAADGACLATLREIARRSSRLLEAAPFNGSAASRLSALAGLGLTDALGQANPRLLSAAYTAFIEPVRSVLPEARGIGWLAAMTNPQGPPVHPLHHILFDLLLDSLSRPHSGNTTNIKPAQRRMAQGEPPLRGQAQAEAVGMESTTGCRPPWIWMTTSSARPQQTRTRRKPVDWPALDQDLAARIRKASADLLDDSPRRRITKNAIRTRLGTMTDTDRWRDRLPEARRALGEVTETTEAFRKRLIARALASLGPQAPFASIPLVRKLSGVTRASNPLIEAALAEQAMGKGE
nr:TniQ family protein [Azospirillum argentinense]